MWAMGLLPGLWALLFLLCSHCSFAAIWASSLRRAVCSKIPAERILIEWPEKLFFWCLGRLLCPCLLWLPQILCLSLISLWPPHLIRPSRKPITHFSELSHTILIITLPAWRPYRGPSAHTIPALSLLPCLRHIHFTYLFCSPPDNFISSIFGAFLAFLFI